MGYFDIHYRTFEKFRGKPITFFEIRIRNDGDLHTLRKYFGDQAKIIGIDVYPNCKNLKKEGFEIWIHNQAVPDF